MTAAQLNSPGQPWSYVRRDHFEVRPGDHWSTETGVERCEMVLPDPVPFDTDVEVSMTLTVTADAIDAPWTILGQFRGTEDTADYKGRSPVFAQEIYAGDPPPNPPGMAVFQFVTRGAPDDPSTGNTAGVIRWRTRRFTLNQPHTLRHRIRFSAGGIGLLNSWVDGVQVITDLACPIGYADARGPAWKFGVYRGAGSQRPIIADYDALTITTG